MCQLQSTRETEWIGFYLCRTKIGFAQDKHTIHKFSPYGIVKGKKLDAKWIQRLKYDIEMDVFLSIELYGVRT